MPFTLVILGTILIYTWILQPRGVHVGIPGAIVVSMAVWSGVRSAIWGLAPKAFWRALRAATLFTIPAVLMVLGLGAALGTLHDRASFLGSLPSLVAWGGAQQWVLQAVVLREAQRVTSPRRSLVLAATLFALVHVPNPLLMLMTFAGALAWCAIFVRHPNVVPLAISHAVGTLALVYAFDDRITGRLRIGFAYLMLDR